MGSEDFDMARWGAAGIVGILLLFAGFAWLSVGAQLRKYRAHPSPMRMGEVQERLMVAAYATAAVMFACVAGWLLRAF